MQTYVTYRGIFHHFFHPLKTKWNNFCINFKSQRFKRKCFKSVSIEIHPWLSNPSCFAAAKQSTYCEAQSQYSRLWCDSASVRNVETAVVWLKTTMKARHPTMHFSSVRKSSIRRQSRINFKNTYMWSILLVMSIRTIILQYVP